MSMLATAMHELAVPITRTFNHNVSRYVIVRPVNELPSDTGGEFAYGICTRNRLRDRDIILAVSKAAQSVFFEVDYNDSAAVVSSTIAAAQACATEVGLPVLSDHWSVSFDGCCSSFAFINDDLTFRCVLCDTWIQDAPRGHVLLRHADNSTRKFCVCSSCFNANS